MLFKEDRGIVQILIMINLFFDDAEIFLIIIKSHPYNF